MEPTDEDANTLERETERRREREKERKEEIIYNDSADEWHIKAVDFNNDAKYCKL